MFDIHTKSLDGVTQQTTIGAIVTLVSSVVVLMLLFSEMRLYTTTELVSRMYPDNGVGRSLESVRLHFDVEFPEIDCELIKFSQEVTRGQTHILEEEQHAEINREKMGIRTKWVNSVAGCMALCSRIRWGVTLSSR